MMLQQVVESLGPLREKVVFLGGTVIPYLLTTPGIRFERLTKDVDCIFDPSSKAELYGFEDKLWELGFEKVRNGAVCQWNLGKIVLDVLPAGPDIIGFDDGFCAEAVCHSFKVHINDDLAIKVISGPAFLGVKLCAFNRRGRDNYADSYDIGDVLLVISGRPEIEAEVLTQASPELKAFIAGSLGRLVAKHHVIAEVIPDYLRQNPVFRQLLPEVTERINRMIACAG